MRRLLTACAAAALLITGSAIAAPTVPVSPVVPHVPGSTI